MQTTSALYNQILADANHRKVVKVDINSVTYTEANILSMNATFDLLSEDALTVGGTCSAKLELTIIPQGETIPKMALIEPYVCLTDGTNTSEWLPQGKFYIYQRELDEDSGNLSIVAYDAMLKAEQTGYTDAETFPEAMDDLVADACARMGVTLDSGTTISHTLVCQFDSTLSLREYLSYVAVAHGGNWKITEEGKLALVDGFPTDSLLIDHEGNVITFGGIGIYV